MSRRSIDPALDTDGLVSVLEAHPVRLAVCFGSIVDGPTHPHSDVDLLVEFDSSVADPAAARLSLVTDLAVALDTDDVDLALFADVDPKIGYEAVTGGVQLLGSAERLEAHRDHFARELDSRDEPSPRERFDAIIDRVQGHVDG